MNLVRTYTQLWFDEFFKKPIFNSQQANQNNEELLRYACELMWPWCMVSSKNSKKVQFGGMSYYLITSPINILLTFLFDGAKTKFQKLIEQQLGSDGTDFSEIGVVFYMNGSSMQGMDWIWMQVEYVE